MTYRLLSSLARHLNYSDATLTNMGISDGLRCMVPGYSHIALFGKPEYYTPEWGVLLLLKTLMPQCKAFVDIGANLGYHTFFAGATRHRDCPIYAFEPDPDHAVVLRRNAASSPWGDIQVCEEAIGAMDGVAVFQKDLDDPSSGSLTEDFTKVHRTVPVSVKTTTFRSFSMAARLSDALVKVDVEGAELEFLDGAEGSLGCVKYLIMEVLGPGWNKGIVNRIINDHGFRGYYINRTTLEDFAEFGYTYNSGQFNWLFCREDPDALRRLVAGSGLTVRRALNG